VKAELEAQQNLERVRMEKMVLLIYFNSIVVDYNHHYLGTKWWVHFHFEQFQ